MYNIKLYKLKRVNFILIMYIWGNIKMTCASCSSNNLEMVVSETNSIYYYCSNCKTDMEIISKNLAFDSILNELCKNLNFYLKNQIKIEIIKKDNKLNLSINDTGVYSIDFMYDFSKLDIYFLENTIHDVIEDLLNLDNSMLDILICA